MSGLLCVARGKTLQCGMSRLEFALVAVILGIVSTLMMQRLQDYQELAERADMEYVATLLKSALRVRIGTLMVEERMRESRQLICENPFSWLAPRPGNYMGEFADDPETPQPGIWYFNRQNCTTVYVAKYGHRLQPDAMGMPRVRYHVRPSAIDGQGNRIGLVFETTAPYVWQ